MKRSEMLEVIMDSFDVINEDAAELILSAIEKAGMKPPVNGTDYSSHGSGDDYFCNATDTHEWDPE